MSIVTKTGDDGTTGLYGAARVSKDDPRIHAYGDIDELNAAIGVVLAEDLGNELHLQLETLQHRLFIVGADLAAPLASDATVARITPGHVQKLEQWIKTLEDLLPAQQWFILPGGARLASLLHLARTICRRAERSIVTLQKAEPINPHLCVFVNRLSDLLFVLARAANEDAGREDVRVQYE